MRFPNLFSPITINGMELKNRIVMTAMHLGYTPEGEVTDQLVDYYALRSKGGVGLIVVGGCPIDDHGGMANMICIHDDQNIPGLKRLTFAVQTEGAKIAAQLYQAGRYVHSSMIGGRKPFSASAVRSRLTGETPRALETEEIPGVQDKFAEAALRAREAGFDAVEVLGSAGYLISQFLSPVTNKRDDAYGGSLDNRMRFGIEVVEKVRAAVGPDYPVMMRLAGNEFMDGGNTNKEARVFAAELEKAGVDLFNVTGGWHETRIPQLSMSVPRKAFVYLARGIKSVVSVPVLASNRVNDPEAAEEILRHGESDMVTMARALHADPFLPEKALEGKTEQIIHCVACNQGCFDYIFSFRPATCMVNPMAGQEGEILVTQAKDEKSVLVVGGGPAGMKAAVTAAQRGHRVVLAEKEGRLGGQLLMNRDIPGRRELVTAAEDLINQVRGLDIEVHLGQEVTLGWVKELAPDRVILASGALPAVPDLPGVNSGNVVQAWEVIQGQVKAGEQVVILGGNAVGLETALLLAHQGTLSPDVLYFLASCRAESWDTLEDLMDTGNKQVTIVEMAKRAGKDIGQSTRWTVMAELKRLGVRVLTQTKALAVTSAGLEVEREEEGKTLLPADTVVLAAGSRSVNSLESELTGAGFETRVVGDAVSPRNALEAIKEGFFAGLDI
jgi:2,4-dienoyl-CoA reductase (NADPH2)